MPLHDWTRVSAGTFHGFHNAWITELARALNNGVLPSPFYAEAEQVAGQTGPDVLALELDSQQSLAGDALELHSSARVTTLLDVKPKVSVTQVASEAEVYSERRNRLAIRHTSGDRLVAYIELLSSGNKANRRMLDRFLDKAYSVIEHGVHLLVVDPYPPGALDPQGIPVWSSLTSAIAIEFDRTAGNMPSSVLFHMYNAAEGKLGDVYGESRLEWQKYGTLDSFVPKRTTIFAIAPDGRETEYKLNWSWLDINKWEKLSVDFETLSKSQIRYMTLDDLFKDPA